MAGQLDGKVAIVTGSAQGLGRAIAERFVAEGATVVVSDIDQGRTEATATKIGAAGAIACDVRDEQQVKDLIDRTTSDHGGLHIMVPNAGVGRPVPLLAMDLAEWRYVTSVNLDGVFLSMRYAAPAIIASGGGSMVALSSVTALRGSALIGHYAAAKAGVFNLVKTLAVELRDQKVRVNAVLPAFIGTELVTRAAPKFEELLGMPVGAFGDVINQKQGRFGELSDVADAVLFLANDATSPWITGAGIVLDGGMTASLL